MGKGKLKKFAAISTYPHVYQNFDFKQPQMINHEGEPVDLKGQWRSAHFKNEQPIVLELACGRGEYTVALAEKFPEKNFIGMDIKGARIYQGAKRALEAEQRNVAFLRTRIELIEHFYAAEEVDEIWITFPDPFLRKSDRNNRLTAPRFLDYYRKILKPGGCVHLKTDSIPLFEFTKEVVAEQKLDVLDLREDIYNTNQLDELLSIQTYYESMHLADERSINYIKFRL